MDRNTKTGKSQKITVLPYIWGKKGFTLIELMIVLSIIAILATLAIPSFQNATIKAKEAVLKEDLFQLRDIIDQYYSDLGAYPDSLEDLVSRHYMRQIPVDPFTKSKDTWEVIPPPMEGTGNVFDVKSGSNLVSLDGVPYNEW